MTGAPPIIAREDHGAVRLIRISSPPHGILSSGGVRALCGAVETALADEAVRVLVIAGGEPGIFVRHYSLSSIGAAATALRTGAIDADSFLDADFACLIDRIAACDIPVIAAINGICMGGGLELALACDTRIAQRDVDHIGLPEVRVDIFPGGGGTMRLARLIGEGPALDMILRGRTVTAERAWQLGIVADIADDAVTAALKIAESLACRDRAALAAIKRLVRSALERPLSQGLRDERWSFARHLETSEHAITSMERLLASGTMLEEAKE